MPSLNYNGQTINHGPSTASATVRKALCTAERKSIEAAVEKTGLPSRLVEKWCEEANVEVGTTLNEQAAVPAKQASSNPEEITFFKPSQVAAARHGGATMSIYANATSFRLSSAAVALLELSDGDDLVFARDTSDEREHVLIGKGEGGEVAFSGAEGTQGFSSAALAKALGVYRPDETRRFMIGSKPVQKSGVTLHKALLQEPAKKIESNPND